MELKELTKKENLEKYYGTPDPWGERSAEKKMRNDAVLSLLEGRRFHAAVDMACGEGVTTEKFGRIADKVYGVDLSETAVSSAASRRGSVKYFSGDMKTFDIGALDPGVDLVACLDSLLFLDREEKTAFVKRIYRLPQPNVHLLLSVRTVPESYRGYWVGHDLMRPRQLEEIVEPYFRVVESMPVELDYFSDRGYGPVKRAVRSVLGALILALTKFSKQKHRRRLRVIKRLLDCHATSAIAELFVQQAAVLCVKNGECHER